MVVVVIKFLCFKHKNTMRKKVGDLNKHIVVRESAVILKLELIA